MHFRETAVLMVSGLMLATLVSGCGGEAERAAPPTLSIPPASAPNSPESAIAGLPDKDALIANPPAVQLPRDLHPEVLVQTTLGAIRIKLDAEKAPETVDNFLTNYVEREFYDGTIFHYVEADFIAIAGGYDKELNPKPTLAPIRNEAFNQLKNRRGTVAMSRQVDYADSATSQFFFNLSDNEMLDHDPAADEAANGYCVFGEVVGGLDVLDKIAAVRVAEQRDFQMVPAVPIVIQSIERIAR